MAQSLKAEIAKLQASLDAAQAAVRVSGAKNSYRRDNPKEYARVMAYVDGGDVTPTGSLTKMGEHLVYDREVLNALLRYEATTPPADEQLIGTHFVSTTDYDELAGIGYEFAIVNVAPGDTSGATAHLDAAAAQGMRLIIGLYHFGGAHPYTYSAGAWGLPTATVTMLNLLESREDDIIAFFGFNEPYWIDTFTEATNPNGAHSADQLRAFRTTIQSVWPTVKIFHDIGEPSAWAPGGYVHAGNPGGIGNKYADQTDVADYVGSWRYCFTDTGYNKTESLDILTTESDFIVNDMGAIPVWDAQSLEDDAFNLIMPTAAQCADYLSACRAALPSNALISWYVWRFSGLYEDYLVNHPELWSSTVPPVNLGVDPNTMLATGGTILREDNSSQLDPRPGLWGTIDAGVSYPTQDPTRHVRVSTGGCPQTKADGTAQGYAGYRTLTVLDGDDYVGERAELGRNNRLDGENAGSDTDGTFALYTEGDHKITFWSFRAPSGSFDATGHGWQTVMQMKQTQPYAAAASGSGQVPVLWMQFGWDRKLWLYGDTDGSLQYSCPGPADNVWCRMALDVIYSTDPDIGRVIVYADIDGDGVAEHVSGELFFRTITWATTAGSGLAINDPIPGHLRLGVYHDPNFYGDTTIHIDNVQVVG